MSDSLVIFGQEYNNVQGLKVTDDNDTELTFLKTPLQYLKSYETITITEDMLSLTTKQFQQAYLPNLPTANNYDTIIYLIENTYTDNQYAAQAAVRLSSLADGYTSATNRMYLRSGGGVAGGDNNFYIGAGSIMHKYVFGV